MPSGISQKPIAIEGAPAPGLGLLTPRELARELGISPRTLMRLHDRKQAPPKIQIGKRHVYKISSVEAWLERREGADRSVPVLHRRRNPISRTKTSRRQFA
jgi:predicted DNA-binding transcriptional regulator AlpA